METPKQGHGAAVSVIEAIFGTAHFIFQSAADLTAHAEGKLVEKVTNGEINAAQHTQYRKDTTLIRQDKVLKSIEEYKAKMKAKTQPESQLNVA